MTNLKKILITTESREIFIVRVKGKNVIQRFCPDCAAESEILTLDEAVSLSNVPMKKLIRLIETGAVHSLETESGHWLVCAASLLNAGNFPKSD